MKKATAKRLIQGQIDKLENSVIRDETWLFQTTSIIDTAFGRTSLEYNFISQFQFRILANNYTSQKQIKLAHDANDQKVKTFLRNCIETLEAKGVYKPEKKNFASGWSSFEMIGFVIGVITTAGTVGAVWGNHTSDVKNYELRQEVKVLKDSLLLFDIFPNNVPQHTAPIKTPPKNKNVH